MTYQTQFHHHIYHQPCLTRTRILLSRYYPDKRYSTHLVQLLLSWSNSHPPVFRFLHTALISATPALSSGYHYPCPTPIYQYVYFHTSPVVHTTPPVSSNHHRHPCPILYHSYFVFHSLAPVSATPPDPFNNHPSYPTASFTVIAAQFHIPDISFSTHLPRFALLQPTHPTTCLTIIHTEFTCTQIPRLLLKISSQVTLLRHK